jgi:hypothetical protein
VTARETGTEFCSDTASEAKSIVITPLASAVAGKVFATSLFRLPASARELKL